MIIKRILTKVRQGVANIYDKDVQFLGHLPVGYLCQINEYDRDGLTKHYWSTSGSMTVSFSTISKHANKSMVRPLQNQINKSMVSC